MQAPSVIEGAVLIVLEFQPHSTEFIAPCLPCITMLPPPGDDWLHEFKHPGQRLIASRSGQGICLYTERGEDWTSWFPPKEIPKFEGEPLEGVKKAGATEERS